MSTTNRHSNSCVELLLALAHQERVATAGNETTIWCMREVIATYYNSRLPVTVNMARSEDMIESLEATNRVTQISPSGSPTMSSHTISIGSPYTCPGPLSPLTIADILPTHAVPPSSEVYEKSEPAPALVTRIVWLEGPMDSGPQHHVSHSCAGGYRLFHLYPAGVTNDHSIVIEPDLEDLCIGIANHKALRYAYSPKSKFPMPCQHLLDVVLLQHGSTEPVEDFWQQGFAHGHTQIRKSARGEIWIVTALTGDGLDAYNAWDIIAVVRQDDMPRFQKFICSMTTQKIEETWLQPYNKVVLGDHDDEDFSDIEDGTLGDGDQEMASE